MGEKNNVPCKKMYFFVEKPVFRAGLRRLYPLVNVLDHLFAVCLRISRKSDTCFDDTRGGIAHSR